ncbi:MAG TPA: hypothetical protein VFO19_13875 [Vicinamibacterales bacterium]|nr:hypothetical protein [Vicinamibacterales bacterium]
MRIRRSAVLGGVLGLVLVAAARPAGQLPLAPNSRSGDSVTPAYEGWYPNPDGTYSLSFGYYNRNTQERVVVALGPDNHVDVGDVQGQPTYFQPGRHWGVFAVKVPADFGEKAVTWTLRNRGHSYAIPGTLHKNWQIDALEGEAGSGNTPPSVRFEEKGEPARGPLGGTSGPIDAKAGEPVSITVWAEDDGKSATSVASSGRGNTPVTLTFFVHQGPDPAGAFTFTPPTARVPTTGGSATTSVTFARSGDYIVRVRANDASGVAGAGHAQCCWTNAFLKVRVK